MLETAPYPARVEHMTDEPSYGLLIRTAVHNGAIRPYSVFRKFGAKGGMGPSTISVEDVAEACKADVESLRRATPVVDPARAVVMGEVFNRRHFSAISKRWCPGCLAEARYHRVWWDIAPITTCPFHGVDLVSRCQCDASLRTVVHFHDHCRKGHDLALVSAPPAPPGSLLVDGYLVRRMLGQKDHGLPHLDASSTEDVIELSAKLGRALLAPGMKLQGSQKDENRRGLIAEGFAAISDIQGKLTAALDELSSRDHKVKRQWGVEKTYGGFYSWLVGYRESPARTAIIEAMSKHAAGITVLKGGQLMGRDVQSDDSMTIVQAAQACGLPFERFRRLTIALGLVPKVLGQGTPFRLDRAKVEELAERLRDHKDLITIARELGMHEPATARLARDGNIEFIVTGGFNQRDMNKWIFHRDSAANLIRKLDAYVVDDLEVGDHLDALPFVAKCTFTTVSKMISLIIEGQVRIRGLDPAAVGLSKFLISKSEAQIASRRARVPGLTLNEAIERLGMSSKSVFSFADGDLLKTQYYGRIRTVAEEELERFMREYASIPQLRQLTGLGWGEVKRRLEQSGVPPVAERPKFEQIMFDRQRALTVLKAV